MRKRIISAVLLLALPLLLSGCILDNTEFLTTLPHLFDSSGYTIEEIGKEEFGRDGGAVELGVWLLPDDNFTVRFPSVSEIYHFVANYQHHWSIAGQENMIVVLQYEPAVYEEAKAYCLEKMHLLDIGIPDHNKYRFIENIELAEGQDRVKEGRIFSFPEHFNLLAYNDQDYKLAFMGFYSPDLTNSDKDREKVLNEWAGFVEENFSELWQSAAEFSDSVKQKKAS